MKLRGGLAAAVVLALLGGGCATSTAFRAGEKAERSEDWDRAVLEYSKATQGDPDNVNYRRSLERARLRAAQVHVSRARSLAARGLRKEAIEELRLALDLDPTSNELPAEIRQLEAERALPMPGPSLQELRQRTRESALAGLVLDESGRVPLGLTFRGASLREVYQALGRSAAVNFVFDPDFQDRPVSLDLREVRFEQALAALGNVGRTFHRVLDDRVVTVIPDTQAKRREYEQQVVKTFFLSNADVKETTDLLRVVLGARRVAPMPASNAITMSDAPDKIAAAERLIGIVDRKRAEVVVEVEILEVNRNKLKEYGIEITSGIDGVDGIAGAIFPDPTVKTTIDDNPYRSSNLIVTNLPGVIYRLFKGDTSTRLLASPHLRSTEGETAQARFGDQVPVPVTVFTPIAQGGVAQQPVTSFEYKNVGVNIDITPRVHHDGEVTLALKLDISSVGAPGFQGVPSFNSRQVTNVIRLRDGETTILAGLISEAERLSMRGLPGLSDLPVLGKIFSRNKEEVQETDIVMTMTPHIVRYSQLGESDLQSIPVGGEGSPLLFEIPAIASPAPRIQEPPRIEPIRPPSPVPTPSPVATP
jgi:general secretion pathway protein D